jgi:hypothetical protein
MKPIILAVSAKKQGGKDTLCSHFEYFFPKTKKYAFADRLKKIAFEVLGLPRNAVYGNEEERNKPTQYLVSRLPLYMREKLKFTNEYLTTRQILQILGSEIFRDMFGECVWVDATIRDIDRDFAINPLTVIGYNSDDQISKSLLEMAKDVVPNIALITDLRFRSEFERLLEQENAFVIRLLRAPFADQHKSENDLDNFDFSAYKDRCLVIDNRNMEEIEKNRIAREWFSTKIKDVNTISE